MKSAERYADDYEAEQYWGPKPILADCFRAAMAEARAQALREDDERLYNAADEHGRLTFFWAREVLKSMGLVVADKLAGGAT